MGKPKGSSVLGEMPDSKRSRGKTEDGIAITTLGSLKAIIRLPMLHTDPTVPTHNGLITMRLTHWVSSNQQNG
ncbi:hypothetical protein G5I_01454 [Acromyrmex echinatior]|uniref:Uncharacterized protein n=1 Tax=Acromyrmex echinatior TaxID=103372 RepID=F4W7N8_ACREC|nr:hypothetical protein G5I_01454 [Acromyrmex echinatior]